MATISRRDIPVPATGVIGTVLGGVALAGVLGQNSGSGSGLLGGLFGNNSDNSAMAVYKAQKADEGQAAITELNVLNKYILPMRDQICAIATQASVTNATVPLLISISSEKSRTDLEQAMCCVPKGTPMLRPEQIGDPYHGGYNEILTRHHHPYPRVFGWGDQHCGCGCGHGPK